MFIASLGLLSTLCSAVLGGVFAIIGFAIGVALVQTTASALDGRSNFDRLVMALLLPGILLSLLCGLLFVGLTMLAGPDILRQMQQGTP